MARPIVQATLALLLILMYINNFRGGVQAYQSKKIDTAPDIKKISLEIEQSERKIARGSGGKNNKERKNKKILKTKTEKRTKNQNIQIKSGQRNKKITQKQVKSKKVKAKRNQSENGNKINRNKTRKNEKKLRNTRKQPRKNRKMLRQRKNKIKSKSQQTKNNKGKRRKKSRKPKNKNQTKLEHNQVNQPCDGKALEAKIKEYIKVSNQLRQAKRINKTCELMEKKADKSLTIFETTVGALNKSLKCLESSSARSRSKFTRFSRSALPNECLLELTGERDILKKCPETAYAKCETSSVEACQNATQRTNCVNELQGWLNMYGPATGSCLQASNDYCTCITALPNVPKDCLEFAPKSQSLVKDKKKCTSGSETGSFGFCKNLQSEAAVIISKCETCSCGASNSSSTPGVVTTTRKPITTTTTSTPENVQWSRRLYKIWNDHQCPNLSGGKTLNESTVEACKIQCQLTDLCTAINYNSFNKSCILYGCSLPVPPPQTFQNSWGYSYNGWHILKWSEMLPNIWGDSQCAKLGNQPYTFATEELCKNECATWRACTAINYNPNTKDCVLRGCAQPVPPPQWQDGDYRGWYVLENSGCKPGCDATDKWIVLTGGDNNLLPNVNDGRLASTEIITSTGVCKPIKYTTIPPLPEATSAGEMTFMQENLLSGISVAAKGYLVFCGGSTRFIDHTHPIDAWGATNICYSILALYNSVWVTWTTGMLRQRAWFSLTKIDVNTMIAVGGIDDNGVATDTMEQFSYLTGKWTYLSKNLTEKRFGHCTVLHMKDKNPYLIVIGGSTDVSKGDSWKAVNTVFEVDVATSTTTELPNLPKPLYRPACTISCQGDIYVSGGAVGDGPSEPAGKSVYKYSFKTGAWSGEGQFTTERWGHVMGNVGADANRRMSVAGGFNQTNFLSSIENSHLYGGTWSDRRTNLLEEREYAASAEVPANAFTCV